MHSDAEDRKRKKRRIRTMNAVNVVELFLVVLSFSAVCQGSDDDISVSCDDVTGSVGKEVNLSCSVSLKITDCCITKYKFLYPEIYNDSSVCQDVSVNSCEQRDSFTCRYTPTTAMKEQFRFFASTTCGTKRTEFTLDTGISVSCDDVTVSVGKEVNLTCSVSLKNTNCCVTKYKFQYPEIFNDSSICRQNVSVNPCEQRNSFTCRYTPTTEMKEQFRFFVQTQCGTGKAEIFTLNTGRVDAVNPAPRFKGTVITVVVFGFIIIIIFIIMMPFIRQTKPNFTNLCRRQNWMFLRVRHDEDNNRPEDVIL
ncbi:uncharacterized protein LOC128025517 isoform X1 [Carassius gibelio]|uniref:uncharacterized protein LOC128025517 isoform X1 n=2 Tax=Carassius gibelio TaxID=101364 RepID=UPI0022794823|nr:uncharacterized protein LOC128025517 isoform X1 [Carassius gibelio]